MSDAFITDPKEIERRSMELIAPSLAHLNLSPEEHKIYSRIIHATGDVGYADLIEIHPQAIASGRKTLLGGGDIYTDVQMVRAGINKKKLAVWGGQVYSIIAEAETAKLAADCGITRSMAAMRLFGDKLNGSVVAIGNAPTALFEVLRLVREENIRPALIVGIPVGFVGAKEAKEALAQNGTVPYITVAGTKGGSSVAAAAVNAIMYLEN